MGPRVCFGKDSMHCVRNRSSFLLDRSFSWTLRVYFTMYWRDKESRPFRLAFVYFLPVPTRFHMAYLPPKKLVFGNPRTKSVWVRDWAMDEVERACDLITYTFESFGLYPSADPDVPFGASMRVSLATEENKRTLISVQIDSPLTTRRFITNAVSWVEHCLVVFGAFGVIDLWINTPERDTADIRWDHTVNYTIAPFDSSHTCN